MAEIVNLRRIRKAKARAVKDDQAAANRAAHGRTKTDRQASALLQAKADQALDGHKLDREPGSA